MQSRCYITPSIVFPFHSFTSKIACFHFLNFQFSLIVLFFSRSHLVCFLCLSHTPLLLVAQSNRWRQLPHPPCSTASRLQIWDTRHVWNPPRSFTMQTMTRDYVILRIHDLLRRRTRLFSSSAQQPLTCPRLLLVPPQVTQMTPSRVATKREVNSSMRRMCPLVAETHHRLRGMSTRTHLQPSQRTHTHTSTCVYARAHWQISTWRGALGSHLCKNAGMYITHSMRMFHFFVPNLCLHICASHTSSCNTTHHNKMNLLSVHLFVLINIQFEKKKTRFCWHYLFTLFDSVSSAPEIRANITLRSFTLNMLYDKENAANLTPASGRLQFLIPVQVSSA